MLLTPTALSAADVAIAKTPEIGAETIVKYTAGEFLKVCEIEMIGATINSPVFPIAVDDLGRDLHLRIDNGAVGWPGGGVIGVTLSCTLEDDTSDEVPFLFSFPNWLTNPNEILPVGESIDGAAPAGKKIKAITGIASAPVGAPGRVNKFSIWSSPAAGTLVLVGATREKVGPYQVPATVSIPARYNASEYTKKGRSEDKTLRITYPWVSSMEHIGRLNGHRCAVLFQVHKDDAVPFSNTIYAGYRPNASPEQGDGNDEVIATSEGPYETFFVFNAL